MPLKFDLQDLVSKEENETFIIVKIGHPNWKKAEHQRHFQAAEVGKRRKKNTKQLTWMLLLKAHQVIGYMAYLATVFPTFFVATKSRLIAATLDRPMTSKWYKFMHGFVLAAIFLFCIDMVAYLLGWHFASPSGFNTLSHTSYSLYLAIRHIYIGPILQSTANICIVSFLLQSADKLFQFGGCVYIKLMMKIKPTQVNPSFECDDVEQPDKGYPMVLIQIPMCNEREVYEQSISAVCQMDWPRNRMLVQVLDDSDDVETQDLIASEVHRWHLNGVNIIYRHRESRTGYKAGNMSSAMSYNYVKDYEFVTIFDADFQPKSDFLKQTMPHFKDNAKLCLVQTRWSFINTYENLLTRLQNINLSYHFEVEQQVNGHFLNFFGFNGTAGVWRISALEECGGWMDRTTVEDMDIAVRAHLCGWKFIFLNDVRCLCELPESFEAYRKQQHRWNSGPAHLFRLCLPDIIESKLPAWKKANLIFLFFSLRKVILPFSTFTLFNVILPLTMFFPEAQLPIWVVCYIPLLLSLINILVTPKSFAFLVPYLFFENTMSVTKFQAMISGLFQLNSSREWVVTKKSGRPSEADLVDDVDNSNSPNHIQTPNPVPAPTPSTLARKKTRRFYWNELALAALLLTSAARSLLSQHGLHFYFLLFQGISFLVVGLDLIGGATPS